jgi:hypothetical protein
MLAIAERKRIRGPWGFSLSEAARISGAVIERGKLPRCPCCGDNLSLTAGEDRNEELDLVGCDNCGLAFVVRFPKTDHQELTERGGRADRSFVAS